MAAPAPELIGRYDPPRVRRGQRVWCEYRDDWCRITAWHTGRIPWPRCNRIGQMGGSGLWVNDTLKRAIRTESAAALMHWFGVGGNAVWRWRKAFAVGRLDTPGSQAAHRKASTLGAEGIKAKGWSAEEREAKQERSKRCCSVPNRWAVTGWTSEELALLGTLPDEELAARIGRSRSAVRSARHRKQLREKTAGLER